MGFWIHLVWPIIIAASLAVELATTAMVSIWFCAGAIVAEILQLCHVPFWCQIVAFVVASAIGFILFCKLWKSKIKGKYVPTNIDQYIGKTVLVTQTINNLKGTGEVKINGQLWTAKTFDDDITVQEGEKVVIKQISGSKLYVYPAKGPEK